MNEALYIFQIYLIIYAQSLLLDCVVFMSVYFKVSLKVIKFISRFFLAHGLTTFENQPGRGRYCRGSPSIFFVLLKVRNFFACNHFWINLYSQRKPQSYKRCNLFCNVHFISISYCDFVFVVPHVKFYDVAMANVGD